ncbi:MAG: hypothetical protein A4E57_01701 [Syntrophorhabdaceae bacterium PtaU1.Bin034]|nr:MAG: hypothetical protein A4E57_01701 [Syntrophorhabdaceae bacterium PtaU1.Bin034]
MELQEKLDFIKTYDPDGMERLKRLLDKKPYLMDKNVYGECFTERQFNLVFDPLLKAAYDRARILQAIGEKESTVPALSGHLAMESFKVFEYVKDLLKRNQIEIAGFEDRNPTYRRK